LLIWFEVMAKQVLDLYCLYKLVTERGGLVEVIQRKIWREITKGLNLPSSITSAAFTLRTQEKPNSRFIEIFCLF